MISVIILALSMSVVNKIITTVRLQFGNRICTYKLILLT